MESKTEIVRARISPSVKKKAERVLLKIGISPSEAINVFYKRIALDEAFPFSLHIPNAETRRAIKNARAGKVSSYGTVEEMFADVLGKNWRASL